MLDQKSLLKPYRMVGLSADWYSETWQISEGFFISDNEDGDFSLIHRTPVEEENRDECLCCGTIEECLKVFKKEGF